MVEVEGGHQDVELDNLEDKWLMKKKSMILK